jgi:hypothetical protein
VDVSVPLNILWTASRGFGLDPADAPLARRHLDGMLARYGALHVVHGNYQHPRGRMVSDMIADAWCREQIAAGRAVTVEPVDAPWDLLGGVAGPYRNGFMAGLLVGRGAHPVGCVAYLVDGSRGTTGCAAFAEHVGIPTRRYPKDSP